MKEDSMGQQKRIFCLGLMTLVIWLIPVASSPGADPQGTSNEEAAEDRFKRGQALLAKGNLDGAIAEFREAIRLSPNHLKAHNNLGAALSAGNSTIQKLTLRRPHRLSR
jgi:Tfp pilus assembly protein PilF